MSEDTIEITYTLVFGPDDRTVSFPIAIDADTLEHRQTYKGEYPEWTRLEVEQCPACPLSSDTSPICPAARSLVRCLLEFGDLISYETVKATVTTNERSITTETSMQRVLSSLIGLRMATCGCPILAKFKPMARFHLPFASREETLFRTAGAYLLAQYFLRLEGGRPDLDLDGLTRLYEDIQDVNICLAKRISEHSDGDANLNAINILDIFAKQISWSIDDHLPELAHLFEPFMPDMRPAGDK